MITDARGPTNWGATPEGRKLRASIRAAIERRVRTVKLSRGEKRLYINAPDSKIK